MSRPENGEYSARINNTTGEISRWVAGVSSNYRYFFLLNLNDVSLKPGGETAVVDFYALPAVSARGKALKDYSYRSSSDPTESSALSPKMNSKKGFSAMHSVDLEMLSKIPDVTDLLTSLYTGRSRVGRLNGRSESLGSFAFEAFQVAQWTLKSKDVACQDGKVIVKVYCGNVLDVTLAATFRVETIS